MVKGVLRRKNCLYPILISVNYNYEISKKGLLGFSVSYLVLVIFRVLNL